MTAQIIEASGLVKRFGEVVALDGLDLSVSEGTVLGLLGPNGAGKTTAVSILTTLLTPDGGSARVAGIDVLTEPERVRERIGLSGQYAAVDENLTGFENLDMIGRLYAMPRQKARARATELLDQFDLSDAGGRTVKTYSGGMRRRLDLAGALVARPQVLVLDEPTTGLDPRSRLDLWATIEALVAEGTTVLLTTQYLEEADRLADQILVIDHGCGIASGSSDSLKAQVGGERIDLTLASPADLESARRVLTPMAVGEVDAPEGGRRLLVPVSGGVVALREALVLLEETSVEATEVGLRLPTLDDVFLSLTGHRAGDDEVAGPNSSGEQANEASPVSAPGEGLEGR